MTREKALVIFKNKNYTQIYVAKRLMSSNPRLFDKRI